MTFNPMKGYHQTFSSGEASGALGAIPGFRTRREADFASAALRAKNYIDGAEDRAKLRALTGQQRQPQQSSQSSPFGNGSDLVKAGSGLIMNLINGGSDSSGGMNFMDTISLGESLGVQGDYGAGAFDLGKSFF